MTTDPSAGYRKISDALSISLVRLYKVGGMALVFIFVGVLMMIVAFARESGAFATWMFGIGGFVTLASFALFAYLQYKGPIKAIQTLRDNKEVIDSLQLLSLKLTKLVSNVQAYSFKNIGMIQSAISTLGPIIKMFLGSEDRNISVKIESLSAMIVAFTNESESVIKDVEKSLMESDFKVLLKYSQDIDGINKRIEGILADK